MLLFNNAAQTLNGSLKEPLQDENKEHWSAEDINLSPSFPLRLLFIPGPLAGAHWQSVKDSADTVDLSYLQAQRRRLRRDSDSEAVSAIASLSMRAVSDRYGQRRHP